MTKEQIEAMEPGPEMNIAVAEGVMGWTLWGDGLEPPSPYCVLWGVGEGRIPHVKVIERFRDRDFSPSTDISAAFEVVEKMCTDFHWQFTLHIEAPCIASARFFQKNSAPHNPEPFARNSVGKLPLSVCRAALLAVMEDNNG